MAEVRKAKFVIIIIVSCWFWTVTIATPPCPALCWVTIERSALKIVKQKHSYCKVHSYWGSSVRNIWAKGQTLDQHVNNEALHVISMLISMFFQVAVLGFVTVSSILK